MSELDFDGRTILVTGARSGIGRAVATTLLVHGARVYRIDRSPADAAGENHARAIDVICDVTDSKAVDLAVKKIYAETGAIHGVVQSAGITRDKMLWKMSDEEWRQVLDVNLTGAFFVMRAVAPLMREKKRGSIVNIASINGLRGKLGQANYAASKAGLIALTKTAARELGAFGIRVNAVAPGMVMTAMTETLPPEAVEKARAESVLNALAAPADVADACLFLLSDLSKHVTGVVLKVDGGQYI